MHWRRYFRSRTQDPRFLWQMVGVVLGLGAAIAYASQGFTLLLNEEQEAVEQEIALQLGYGQGAMGLWEQLLADESEFESLLASIALMHKVKARNDAESSVLQRRDIDLGPYLMKLTESELSTERKAVATSLWDSCQDRVVSQQLELMALQTPPLRYANQAIAIYWQARGEFGNAIKSYEREGRIEEAASARKAVVHLLRLSEDYDGLKRVAADPRYADVIDLGVQIDLKVAADDWWSVWWLIPRRELTRIQLGPSILAGFAGLWWFLFALHAGQTDSQRGARWWLCALAVPLGVLSIWVTDFCIYWQEANWQISSSTELVNGVRYYVVGVGLREELSKLLLLLPLTPFLARRGNTLETLIVGACVGLGFAILENQLYFVRTMGSAAVARFATANFFHMASTSIIGLGVVRAMRAPRQRAPEAVAWFLLIVLAHGFYDAFIALPALYDYSIASSVILVLIAYQFFHELRYARADRSETVSLTATFLFSVSIVAAATLIYLSSQFGFWLGLMMLGPDIIAIAVMVYVFLREMPNSLVTV